MGERIVFPFTPVVSKVRTTSTTTANVALTMRAGSDRVIVLSNPDATDLIFVEFGAAAVAATTTTSMVLLPGEKVRIKVPEQATYIAAIASANTPTLYITEGTGN